VADNFFCKRPNILTRLAFLFPAIDNHDCRGWRMVSAKETKMERKMKSGGMLRVTGCTESLLMSWLRRGRLRRPPKDTAGNFEWDEEHIAEVRQALATYQKSKKK
jgi:hypothetical protein